MPGFTSTLAKSERAARWLLVAALITALVLNIAVFVRSGNHTVASDERCYDHMGWNWVQGIGMSRDGSGPSSYVTPAYPTLVALVYLFFGHSPQAVFVVQILLAVLTCYLVYRLGLLLSGSKPAAALAALAVAAYLPLQVYTSLLMTETLFTFLLVLSVLCLLTALKRKQARWFALAGLTAGLAALCRPSLLPMPALVAVVTCVAYRRQWKLAAGTFAAFTGIFLLTLVPWIVRNYVVWDMFMPGSSEGGYVFWSGTYGKQGDFSSYYNYPPDVQRFLDTHPSEVEKNRFFTALAIKNIKADPAHFAELAGRKFMRLWFNLGYGTPPSRASIAIALLHFGLLALAIWSFRVVPNKAGFAVILLILCGMSVVHMLTFAVIRYGLPMMPLVILLASQNLTRLEPSTSAKPGRPRHR